MSFPDGHDVNCWCGHQRIAHSDDRCTRCGCDEFSIEEDPSYSASRLTTTVDLCAVDTVWLDEYVVAGWAKRWRMAHRRRIQIAAAHDYNLVPKSERRGRIRLWWETLLTGDGRG